MELILWRHAEAEDGSPDHERQLTTKGARQAKKIAEFLRDQLPHNTRVLVSPAIRTQQTIQALTSEFEIDSKVGAGASAQEVLEAAGWPDNKKSVLIVGHQPYIGEIAALLLADSPSAFSVKKGAVWWLSRRDRLGDYQTILRLAISPDFL